MGRLELIISYEGWETEDQQIYSWRVHAVGKMLSRILRDSQVVGILFRFAERCHVIAALQDSCVITSRAELLTAIAKDDSLGVLGHKA